MGYALRQFPALARSGHFIYYKTGHSYLLPTARGLRRARSRSSADGSFGFVDAVGATTFCA